ncbi:monocarboxylate transporter 5-like [Antedon mediterranea]|uniref:monocarboxylate transporter 5-like n=1 Tax=Antedon mediterranea TaxID=105859 RepID=UPI003AF77F35
MSCDSKGICDFFKKYWSIVIVFTAFINNIFYSGFIHSYNLLYLELHNTFNSTATQTGIPGAVSVSLFSGCCIFVTFIFQKIGHQKTVILGVTLCCLGLLVSSFSQRITWLYITYGVFYGFGICCIYMSFTDKIMRSFKKRYSSTVTCTAFIGASLGIMLAPVIEWLYKQYKWRVTLRIFSGVFAVIGYSSTLVLVDCESTTHGHYNETEESDDNEEGKQNKDENNSEHECRQDEDTNDSIEKLERKEEDNSRQSDGNKDHDDGEPVMFKEVDHTNDVSNAKMTL